MHTYNHILFIHSSFDGHSSYFHLLTIVNDAAINVGIQISVQVPSLLFWGRFISRSGIAGSQSNFIFNFLMSSIVWTQLSNAQSFQILHIPTNTCFLFRTFKKDSYSNECEVVSHCEFQQTSFEHLRWPRSELRDCQHIQSPLPELQWRSRRQNKPEMNHSWNWTLSGIISLNPHNLP